jgi:hypothetical protein
MYMEYRKRRVIFPIFLLLVMLCWMVIPISHVKAAEPIGHFSQIVGIVDVLRGGAMPAIPVKVGDPIFEKDVIRTKSNSRAEVIFIDGNTIKISQRSRIDINEYLVGENKSSEILKLQRGRVEAIVPEKNAKRISVSPSAHKFEIHTPCAVTGVRSTQYAVVQSDNCATIFVSEGTVYVYNPKFPDKVVEVHAGQITRACEDSPPFQPKDATEEEKKRFEKLGMIDEPTFNFMDIIITTSPPGPGIGVQPPVTDLYPELLQPRRSAPASTGGIGCFTPDIKVLMGDQTFKNIVDLKIGDLVQSFDIESGKKIVRKVTRVYTANQDHYYLINHNLKVTGSHPIITPEGKWKEVRKLKLGDKIQSDQVGKAIEITSIEKKDLNHRVYNFKVEEGHNYFVSPDGIEVYLVHNPMEF